MAASVTKEVDESGGGDMLGAVGVVCADGLIVVDGLIVADGLMIVDGKDGAVITVGTGRDLSRRCASVMCARILLILSECEGTPVALMDGSALEAGGTTRGVGVPVGEGVVRGV
jgi:hypothetical protein